MSVELTFLFIYKIKKSLTSVNMSKNRGAAASVQKNQPSKYYNPDIQSGILQMH